VCICQNLWQAFHRWESEKSETQGAGALAGASRLEAMEASFLGSSSSPFSGSSVAIALVGHRPTALVQPTSDLALRCMEKGLVWPLQAREDGQGPANTGVPVARLELDLLTGKRSGKEDVVSHAQSLLQLLLPSLSTGGPRLPDHDGMLGRHTSHVVSLLRSLVADTQDALPQHGALGRQHVLYLPAAQSLLGGTGSVRHGAEGQAAVGMLEAQPSVQRAVLVAGKLREALEAMARDPSFPSLHASEAQQGPAAGQHAHQTAAAVAATETRVGDAMLSAAGGDLKGQRMQKIAALAHLIANSAVCVRVLPAARPVPRLHYRLLTLCPAAY